MNTIVLRCAAAVIARARDLVRFARQQGYQSDELINIIQGIR